MSTKHTFWTLSNKYDKIEVPIIQRDYAQGRETAEVIRLRNKFINEFLIESLLSGDKIELDFVYGSILLEKKEDESRNIFIPLDGQQRLTTLFLLHFFIALKEKRIDEIRNTLSKFTYETRPSAHDFCTNLIEKFSTQNLQNIKFEIKNSEWYSELWDNDQTVSGMLNMLDTFSKNENLSNSKINLLDRLIDVEVQLISFYFIPLENFGLTENLYIRMNARGKMLTDFENFKSEFFKIINYNQDLLESVKDKIEYKWVDNLWSYRISDSYVIDEPFMQFLSFITEMLYFKNAEFRATNYENDFLDFKLLKRIYSDEKNLLFLIFALDFIKHINEENKHNILWKQNTTLKDILKDMLVGKGDTNEMFILFSSINYFFNKKDESNHNDFIRVVRNLINNTKDNSRREWPRLLNSINNLIADENVYQVLLRINDSKDLIGFEVEQRHEEIFKAKLIDYDLNVKKSLFAAEDVENFSGNISNLIISNYAIKKSDFEEFNLDDLEVDNFNLDNFNSTFEAYKEVSKNDFNLIWGDLLVTTLYYQTHDSRLLFHGDYKKRFEVIWFAKEFSKVCKKESLNEYLINIQKQFILNLSKTNTHFEEIRESNKQLYLYYIMHIQIYGKEYKTFFKNGYNFGWLAKVAKYKTLFTKGIVNCQYFPNSNPIYQTYKEQFRYNLGLNQKNALDEEIIGVGNKREPFALLIEWAKS
ncbi:DUF262 domain-containing protein [Flavobacterium sp.]|jgi:hypothetical protein|uniref:DUF262 domain-containing protein n=1 Tax=Flavobacterium sp. TaxID=239 RepID=UPI0037BEA980